MMLLTLLISSLFSDIFLFHALFKLCSRKHGLIIINKAVDNEHIVLESLDETFFFFLIICSLI